MPDVIYEIVEHDGGFAYRVKGSLSETFPTQEEARIAAAKAAVEHEQAGSAEDIEYEDSKGRWHQEHAIGTDRPSTAIADRIDEKD